MEEGGGRGWCISPEEQTQLTGETFSLFAEPSRQYWVGGVEGWVFPGGGWRGFSFDDAFAM